MGGKPDTSAADAALAAQQAEAARARQEEEARQRRISEGTALINAIFDGGMAPTGYVGKPTQAGTYYDASGNPVDVKQEKYFERVPNLPAPGSAPPQPPMYTTGEMAGLPIPTPGVATYGPTVGDVPNVAQWGDTFGNPSIGSIAPLFRNEERTRFTGYDPNKPLYSGAQNYTGFGDDFFNNRRQAYLDYYQPQLQDQYGNARDQLTFDLARAGLLRSTVAGDQLADLENQFGLQQAAIQSRADDAVTQLRNSINAQRSAAISQLNATADPDVAANTALSSVQAIQGSQPTFDPLGELFKNAAIGAANYRQGVQNFEASQPLSPYNPQKNRSGRVVA